MLFGLLMIVLLAWLMRIVFDPSPFYGNLSIVEKMHQYEPVADDFNAVFIGSSIILQNFNPILFDEGLPDSLGIKTYNLGFGGTLPPETYDFYRKMLRINDHNIRYVFIELRDIELFSTRHLHTLRKKYWMTPLEYRFIVQATMQSSCSADMKRMNIRNYGIALLERLFNINYFNDLLGCNLEEMEEQLIKQERLKHNNRRGHIELKGSAINRNRFLKDTTVLSRMAEAYRRFNFNPEFDKQEGAHLKRIRQIIEDSEAHCIHCFFVCTPKHLSSQIRETMNLLRQIPERNLINVADPDKFPELYYACNSLNVNHFNVPGTELLTMYIAEEFLKKIIADSLNRAK